MELGRDPRIRAALDTVAGKLSSEPNPEKKTTVPQSIELMVDGEKQIWNLTHYLVGEKSNKLGELEYEHEGKIIEVKYSKADKRITDELWEKAKQKNYKNIGNGDSPAIEQEPSFERPIQVDTIISTNESEPVIRDSSLEENTSMEKKLSPSEERFEKHKWDNIQNLDPQSFHDGYRTSENAELEKDSVTGKKPDMQYEGASNYGAGKNEKNEKLIQAAVALGWEKHIAQKLPVSELKKIVEANVKAKKDSEIEKDRKAKSNKEQKQLKTPQEILQELGWPEYVLKDLTPGQAERLAKEGREFSKYPSKNPSQQNKKLNSAEEISKNIEEVSKNLKEEKSADGKSVTFTYEKGGSKDSVTVPIEKAAEEKQKFINQLLGIETTEQEKIPEGTFKAPTKADEKSQSIKEKLLNKEKVQLSEEEGARVNIAIAKIGLGPQDVKTIPGWESMSGGQRLLALELYKNFFVENIRSKAEERFDTKQAIETGPFKGIKKWWRKQTKSFRIKQYEQDIHEEMTFGYDKESSLIEIAKKVEQIEQLNFNVNVEGDGKLKIDFAQKPENISPEDAKAYDRFNAAATKLQMIPLEWNDRWATNKQRKAYEEALGEYKNAFGKFKETKEKELGKVEGGAFLITANAQLDLLRFNLANPDLDKAIDNIQKGPWRQIFTSKRLTYGVIAGLGFGLRKWTSIGVPIIGALMGGTREAVRTRQKLKEQDRMMTRGEGQAFRGFMGLGERDVSDKTIQESVGTKVRTINNGTEEKSFDVAFGLSDKIDKLAERAKQAQEAGDEKKAAELFRMLENRIDYTEKKVQEGRVNYDTYGKQADNQFTLTQSLVAAKTLLDGHNTYRYLINNVQNEVNVYVDQFIDRQDKRLARRRFAYTAEKFAEGAAKGAAVAWAFGYARELIGWGHHNGGGGGEGHTPHPGPQPVPNPEPIPAQHEISPDAYIHKGEGIEHALRRQIEHNPDIARGLGYSGDIHNTTALHQFSGKVAHQIAFDKGYVNGLGKEVRVDALGIDKAAYEIQVQPGGGLSIHEWMDGKEIETHTPGTPFETARENYEYGYNRTGLHTGGGNEIHHDAVTNTENTIPEKIKTTQIAGEKTYNITDRTVSNEKMYDITDRTKTTIENTTHTVGPTDAYGRTSEDILKQYGPGEMTEAQWKIYRAQEAMRTHVAMHDPRTGRPITGIEATVIDPIMGILGRIFRGGR